MLRDSNGISMTVCEIFSSSVGGNVKNSLDRCGQSPLLLGRICKDSPHT